LGRFHAQKLSARDDVKLLAVVDPLPAARNRLAAETRVRAVADHRELLGEIDAAVIAAPTRLHHRIALDYLHSGIHLLVEKPLAPALAEADELVAAARRSRVVLQVGHVERFNPAMTVATHYARNPKYIEATRASGFTFRSTDIGVVLDLMIHDLDLILRMVRSPLRKVEALGLSVLGGHEDAANARLEFDNGCVAVLNASRVSRDAVRRMNIWSPRAFTSVDFAAGTVSVVHPSEALLTRQFDVDALSDEQVDYYKDHLFEEHLPRKVFSPPAVDALAAEQDDFLQSIRMPREPRVPGHQAREGIAVAEQILAKIDAHRWDEAPDGPVGPRAAPCPGIIPSPHFHPSTADLPAPRKEAG
jgi:predicted dehydrogenase